MFFINRGGAVDVAVCVYKCSCVVLSSRSLRIQV